VKVARQSAISAIARRNNVNRYSDDVLVLRATERGASDKLLTLLSAQNGRSYAILKGAHSTRHREAAASEPFTWSNMEFYERGGVKWVKDGTAIDSFGGIRYDAEKLFLAAYFADVAFELSDDGAPAGEILPLCLNALYMLSKTKGEDRRIKAAFEMRAAAISGFAPHLDACGSCGAALDGGCFLDVMNGAFLCNACHAKKHAMGAPFPVGELGERVLFYPLDLSAASALRFVVNAEPKRVFAFRLTDDASLKKFEDACENYLLHHLERGFPSLQNYKRLLAVRAMPMRDR
jgi:DNA repair protein RecO (recombination protein O)